MNPPTRIIPLLDDKRLRRKSPSENLLTSLKGFIPCKCQLQRDLHDLKGSKLASVSSFLKA